MEDEYEYSQMASYQKQEIMKSGNPELAQLRSPKCKQSLCDNYQMFMHSFRLAAYTKRVEL